MSDKAIYPRAGEPRGTASAGDLSEPMARIVRDELTVVRDEMRTQMREEIRAEVREQTHSRTVKMHAGAATASLYGGGALAVTVGLLLALMLPGWAAFLIVAAGLFGLALALRSAAHGRRNQAGPAAAPTAPAATPATPRAPAAPTAPASPAAPAGPAGTGSTEAPGAPGIDGTPVPPGPAAAPVATPDPHAPHHRA